MKKRIYEIGILTFLLDQFIKYIVMSNFSYREILSIIPNFFYLTYVKNTGGAWSIFAGNPIILILVGLICMIGLVYYLYKKVGFSKIEVIYFGLLLGGIVGNFVDRIMYNGVIDYLGFIFDKYYFPIFNLADMCIVGGVILLMIDSLRGDINGIGSNKK